ncbi:MAG: ABC transporter ATP-binding protein [Bauldia sp.]|nr:ABC transporter ATP-binding protein [Bauldia sp.]
MLQLEGISKRFGALAALSEVHIDFAAGEVHCLLGENGAGKSTLCNIVFGVHEADSGSMTLDGAVYRPTGPAEALGAGIAMVHQHFSLLEDMSVVDNLILGQGRGVLKRQEWAEKVRALGERFSLPLEPFARVGDLSIGERQRVEIVKCLMREPRVLILDEPTAVLLPDEIAALLAVCRRVAANGCAVILVTHKLAEIKQVADRVTVLRGGVVVTQSTEPEAEIDRLVEAMIGRDLGSLSGVASGAVGAEGAVGAFEASHTPDEAGEGAEEVVQIDGLTVRDTAGAVRLDNVTITLRRGEIVGVAGVEGNGQSELGLVLAGLLPATEGKVFVGTRELTRATPAEVTAAGVGIVPEDRHRVGSIVAMSLTDNLLLNRVERFTRFGLMRRGAMRRTAEAMIGRFDVRAAGPEVPFSSLSGGNQQKAVLARELETEGLVFLVASQPTRGLDVGAIESVYRLIREACARGVAVLLVSSELDELIGVADRIVVLYRGRAVGTLPARPENRPAIGAMMAGHAQ